MSGRIIDLSHAINSSTPPWPGCPPVETTYIDRASMSRPGERHSNSSRFAMNIHCGTHMDAPFHFFDDGRTIDQVPLGQTMGRATLIPLLDKQAGCNITADDLLPWRESLQATRKAIIHTGWASRWKTDQFFVEYPDLTQDAGQLLVESGVHLVGVEQGSVDFPPNDTHVVLLRNDVVIVECLTNLDRIDQDEFQFAAAPLSLEGRDGSPVRATAILGG